MKTVRNFVMMACLGVCSLASADTVLNQVVAKANNEVITDYDVKQQAAFLEVNLNHPVNLDEAYADLIKLLVMQQLQIQYLHQHAPNFRVSDDQVDKFKEVMAKRLAVSPVVLAEKFSEVGYDLDALNQHIRQEVRVHNAQALYVSQNRNELSMSEQEVEKAAFDYRKQKDAYCLQDYWLPRKQIDAETKDELEHWRVDHGDDASLTNLVKIRDTQCKILNDWPDTYIQAVQDLDESALSEIVDTDNGLHILRVTSIDRDKTTQDIAKLKAVIQERNLMVAVQKWTHTLYDQAYVKIYVTAPPE